ncbi:MAG: C-terminal helicase domain-containing protein, partial [Methylophilaceae bacterium]|nr:C-terminal helicase domain-containing protein [Methylophilaceae bacterium]
QKQAQFIVAGDPFQIEPIVEEALWKDENIYTLVGLNKEGSFKNPITKLHNYPVTPLTTQYRSIPSIGKIFSGFTYDGILEHHRTEDSRCQLKFNGLDVKSLNLINFSVSQYESIYMAKSLKSGTHYQIYSALFTFEFVQWLAEQIKMNHADKKISIGVIAPYRAQERLLRKLNDSWNVKPEAVEIQVGTIHAFQGDECDIIIAVFNPPPRPSEYMFINQHNLLNVAISRARDYLFIVLPDNETKGKKLAKIEGDVRKSGDDAFREYASHAIEQIIWGDEKYIENRTFSTGHQMVNVYRKPERRYEVRSDDSAIDVQIHETD